MKKLLFFFGIMGLAACANLHRYDKPDAALVSRLCSSTESPSLELDGKRYFSDVGIAAVDGNLPGTGVSCKENPIYRIDPNAKQIKFFVAYQEPNTQYMSIAYPQLNVQLHPNTSYILESNFDGSMVRLILKDALTGSQIAKTETSDIKRQSTANAALSVIPLLLIKK